jgi:hypothetical protein
MNVEAAILDGLTTPDSEDWLIVPDGRTIRMVALRERVH